MPAPAHADVLTLSWDNDLLTGTDRGYTNGVRLSWLSKTAEWNHDCRLCPVAKARDSLVWLPGMGSAASRHAATFSLRQIMVTPEDIEASEPVLDDVPYVGYLSAEASLWSWSEQAITGYGLLLGVVGKDSGAENTQRWVHKVTGSTSPSGWGNQLGTDLVGGVQVLHGRKLARSGSAGDYQNEFSWVGGARLSNFITSVETGLVWRAGYNLPGNFVPDYAGVSTGVGLPGIMDVTGPGWSVFAGLVAEWVPYSYLDERSGDYSYDQQPWIGHAGMGVGWHTPGFNLSLTLRATTAQEASSKQALSFGTLSFSWQY
ncbi:MAG: lipid A deacylase LpxR family protein [Marinobacter sp.]|nr:lipid A deacylase LpxR family protein [Marinobacter sp.]